MRLRFANSAAFSPMNETIVWTQDKSPHLRGTFSAAVVHGEGESGNAGHTRGGVPADAYSVICDAKCAAVSGITVGDTLRLESGVVLDVQQITKDQLFGWVIKCTANARAPK